jgi:hypothetical protein
MQWLLDHIKSEWATVMKAPILVVVVFVLGGIVSWWLTSTLYQADLQTLRDTVTSLETKPHKERTIRHVTSTATPPSPSPSPPPQAMPTNVYLGMGGHPTALYSMQRTLGWPKKKATMKLKEVLGAHYISGEVPLDGYVYYDSTFDGVTFRYDGHLPTGGWVGSRVNGGRFESHDPGIKTAMIIVQSLNINPVLQCGIVPLPPLALPSP